MRDEPFVVENQRRLWYEASESGLAGPRCTTAPEPVAPPFVSASRLCILLAPRGTPLATVAEAFTFSLFISLSICHRSRSGCPGSGRPSLRRSSGRDSIDGAFAGVPARLRRPGAVRVDVSTSGTWPSPLGRRCGRRSEDRLSVFGRDRDGPSKRGSRRCPPGLHDGPRELGHAHDVHPTLLHAHGVLLPIALGHVR